MFEILRKYLYESNRYANQIYIEKILFQNNLKQFSSLRINPFFPNTLIGNPKIQNEYLFPLIID